MGEWGKSGGEWGCTAADGWAAGSDGFRVGSPRVPGGFILGFGRHIFIAKKGLVGFVWTGAELARGGLERYGANGLVRLVVRILPPKGRLTRAGLGVRRETGKVVSNQRKKVQIRRD